MTTDFIAAISFIARSVTVGCGSLIGARSSVFLNMPAGMICIGSPAKPIKSHFE